MIRYVSINLIVHLLYYINDSEKKLTIRLRRSEPQLKLKRPSDISDNGYAHVGSSVEFWHRYLILAYCYKL